MKKETIKLTPKQKQKIEAAARRQAAIETGVIHYRFQIYKSKKQYNRQKFKDYESD